MSERDQRSGQTLFDPEAFALWRLIAAFPERLRAVRCLDARRAPPHPRLDGHVHPDPTLVCCLAGAARIEHPHGALDLAAGEAAVVAAGAWHRHAPLRGDAAVFAQGLIGRRSDVLLATARRRWWLTLAEEPARGLLSTALADARAGRRAAVRELVAGFAREPARALAMTPAQAAMARFVWRNFWRPIGAAEILRASGLARAQAHAAFRACYGEPPKRALTRCRLTMAASLAAEGVPHDEVAARSGFIAPARLTRARRMFALGGTGRSRDRAPAHETRRQ